MRTVPKLLVSSVALALAGGMSACAQMPATLSASPAAGSGFHPNSIQPETTLSVSAEASVKREPDIAYITAGVREEAPTAQAAMAAQARSMSGVFDALARAGIDRKDMQTSNLSLQPVYEYEQVTIEKGRTRNEQRLRGYVASNQLTVKVRDLDNLGETLDSLVSAGGNTFSGLSFALDDASEAMDEARRKAMKDAMARAELLAGAAGLKVARIVSINESGGYMPQPVQMGRMAMSEAADVYSTPIAGGEVGYSASVHVVFELTR